MAMGANDGKGQQGDGMMATGGTTKQHDDGDVRHDDGDPRFGWFTEASG